MNEAIALSRQIHSLNNAEEAIPLLQGYSLPSSKPVLAALKLCFQQRRADLVPALLRVRSNEGTRQEAIRVYSRCSKFQEAIDVLRENPSIGILNAALSAQKDCRTALDLLEEHSALATAVSYSIVLRILANATQQGQAASRLHDCMINKHLFDDHGRLYHFLMDAWVKTDEDSNGVPGVDRAFQVYENMPEGMVCKQTLDILTKAYGKRKNWEMVHRLEAKAGGAVDSALPAPYGDWSYLERVKVSGKPPYWIIGSYQYPDEFIDWTVAIQPNRNTRSNGIKLIVLRDSVRVAHLLLITTEPESGSNRDTTSSMMGLFINEACRKYGWTKHIIGLWLLLCSDSGLRPRTEVIRKPLLSLVLQHSFGFTPASDKTGINMDVFPPPNGDTSTICVYSSTRCVEGAFAPRDIEREGLVIYKERPEGKGRSICINCKFQGPVSPQSALPGYFKYHLTSQQIRDILLGE